MNAYILGCSGEDCAKGARGEPWGQWGRAGRGVEDVRGVPRGAAACERLSCRCRDLKSHFSYRVVSSNASSYCPTSTPPPLPPTSRAPLSLALHPQGGHDGGWRHWTCPVLTAHSSTRGNLTVQSQHTPPTPISCPPSKPRLGSQRTLYGSGGLIGTTCVGYGRCTASKKPATHRYSRHASL